MNRDRDSQRYEDVDDNRMRQNVNRSRSTGTLSSVGSHTYEDDWRKPKHHRPPRRRPPSRSSRSNEEKSYYSDESDVTQDSYSIEDELGISRESLQNKSGSSNRLATPEPDDTSPQRDPPRRSPVDDNKHRDYDRDRNYPPRNSDQIRPSPMDDDRYRRDDDRDRKYPPRDRDRRRRSPVDDDRYRDDDRDRKYPPRDRDRRRRSPVDDDRYRDNDRDRYNSPRDHDRRRRSPVDNDRYRDGDRDRKYSPRGSDRRRRSPDEDRYRSNPYRAGDYDDDDDRKRSRNDRRDHPSNYRSGRSPPSYDNRGQSLDEPHHRSRDTSPARTSPSRNGSSPRRAAPYKQADDLDDHEYDFINSLKRSTKDKQNGGVPSQNGVSTVNLNPGVHGSRSRERPPPHHTRSTDTTQYASKSSMMNGDIGGSENGDKSKLVHEGDENEERGNWSGRFDFILSMLGYAVGLGNIWRFPYLCYRNGGGAFLFPFLLMMVIIGLPLFYMEAALGQFSSCGAMTCWHFAPLFKGVGIAMVLVSAMTGIYYNMILGWSLHYMFSSFTSDLPFATCDNPDWNTVDCKLKLPLTTCSGDLQSDDGLCMDEQGHEAGIWNKTLFTLATGRELKSPSQEYWESFVLGFSDGIENFGMPKWDLVLSLLLAWIICFLCLLKGIKTTGKVVYFTAIFPYVVLFILLMRGVTLEGAGIGVRYFITPNFARLGDAGVWKDAANQVFFSMSIAGGGLITLSSYNRFKNNILRDSLIVVFGDSFTCVLGGFVIFSYLGYMAGQLNVGIEEVAADGAGLAFVVYPEAVSNIPPATLWALLFFFMLLLLGLDSQFAMIETVLTGVLDQYPRLRPKKTLVILCICIVLFILGLPLTCPGGMYLLQLMDNYVGGMTLIIIGFFEIISIVYVYGVTRFCQDINLMTGSTQFIFWKVTWCVLSPLTIAFIFIFMFIDYEASSYDTYIYPAWADALGWLFTLSCVLAIPIVMLYKICREREGKTYLQKLKLLCLPSIYWGPALKKHRQLVTYVDGFLVDPNKGLEPKASFVNYGFESTPEPSLKAESKTSLGASRVSMVSSLSRGTARSDNSRMSFETNV